MNDRVRRRFEAKVDRSGSHHVWLGAAKADGTGMVKIGGRVVNARRVAWELAYGPIGDDDRIERCAESAGCVRIDHLSIDTADAPVSATAAAVAVGRGRRPAGSMRQTSSGRWELSVTVGRYDDDHTVRRAFRTVDANSQRSAARALATFVAELNETRLPARRQDVAVTVDAAVAQFLTEHLAGEKGREPKTVNDYRLLHAKWFAPEIGTRPVRSIDEATIDRLFGNMARAGLSRSRMNQAKALYRPFFRWAKTRRLVDRNPMADFQLPTARKPSKERTPPEINEMVLLLATATEVIPDVALILTLGAVTGMRRGELLGLRRSRLHPETGRIVVDSAIDEGRRVKTTKTRRERIFHLDTQSMTLLLEHCDTMAERATNTGTTLVTDPFIFSLNPDCSTPIPPDHLTRRVAILKEHLGIADKHPATIERENQALDLYRQPPTPRPDSATGPAPKGGLSHAEIGRRLNRSERWATTAIAAAQRREQAAERGANHQFDGSILALRKFTSTELLDAGFNIALIAQRQGHSPQVLIHHYAKARNTADQKAANHLGNAIHSNHSTAAARTD